MPGGDAGRLTDGVDIGRNRAVDRPCGDLRVLDMSIGVAGKYCTMLMAGFGADVIAIESPKRGDVPRGPEALRDTLDGPDALSAMLGRGKRRVTLDWSTRAGQRLLLKLAAKADVLVVGSPLQSQDERVPSFEVLQEVNPAIVVTSITPFGTTGPYAGFAADELVVNALGGFLHGVGDPDREPLGGQGVQTQTLAGACAYFATLVALHARLADGLGQLVDISVQEVAASTLEGALTFAAYSGWVWRRSGSRRAVAYHPVSNYRRRDGYIHISVLEDRDWRSLCAMLGCPEHGEDPRFATAGSRLEHAKEVDELLTRRLADRSRSELYHAGQARRLPLAPVNSIADLLVSPQLRARSFFYEPFDQDLRSGAIGPPFKFSETPWTAGGCSRQGEDTREVYGRLLGLDEAALDELAQCGVI